VSKTGALDDTVTIDNPEVSFLAPLLTHLAGEPSPQRLVDQDLPGCLKTFTQTAQALGLRLVPSLGRHSGASIDAASGFRTSSEIKRMGRWKSDKSVRRYEKRARINDTWRTLTEAQQNYFMLCQSKLREVVLFGELPPALQL
jgi:hypothetical protein